METKKSLQNGSKATLTFSLPKLCLLVEYLYMSKTKAQDLSLYLLFYLIAYACGFVAGFWIQELLLRLFISDLAATFIIFAFSVLLNNSSVYDPYWSLTPLLLSIYLVCIFYPILNVYHYIFLACLAFWSLRLTANWAVQFRGKRNEDWRYTHYKSKYAEPIWQLINLFGIHMMPTVLVFLAFIPVRYFVGLEATYKSLPGSLIILVGTLLEMKADIDLRNFASQNNSGSLCQEGLWNYSRHPNYLGEIVVWFGVYFALLGEDVTRWYFGLGAVLILLMFIFISIPMMEKNQLKHREGYALYQKTTSKLLILPKKN